jgi:hypothetical protein
MTSESDSSDHEFASFIRPAELSAAANDRQDRQQLRATIEKAFSASEARSAPTPEQDAALQNLATGKGTPLALAKVLRPAAHLLETWPLPDNLLVRTVRGLVQLSDVILTDVETGGTPLDQAVFLGHYAQRVGFDGPERRAYFYERAIAELKSLDAARTEPCGSLSRLLAAAASPRRCQQCFERPIKQCELRIVEEVAGTILNEQKSDQRRARAADIWNKPVWSVWAVLSWIVFRDWKQICAVEHAAEFTAARRYDSLWTDAEVSLLSALQADHLQAVKDQKGLPATHWYGVLRIEPDTWFQQRSVRRCWPGPSEWNGFQDAFWSLGQMILWIVTRDPDDVDQASDDAGRVGSRSGYGGFAAAVRLEELLRGQRERVEDAANDLRRRCQRSELKALSGQDLIPATAWIDLKIEFETDGVPVARRERTRDPAYDNIRFSRVDALGVFKPAGTLGDMEEIAAHAERLNLRRQRQTQRANRFDRKQKSITLAKRGWFRLTEIADEYGRKPRSLAVDDKERERALEALRRSILTGEFVDDQNRSRVLNMHPSPVAHFRFEASAADDPSPFNSIAEHLWLTYQDCVNWFDRHGLDFPLRLQRKPMAQPEGTRTEPAMIAVGEAINGAIHLYAAGITQTDADYDERTGEALRSPGLLLRRQREPSSNVRPEATRAEAAQLLPATGLVPETASSPQIEGCRPHYPDENEGGIQVPGRRRRPERPVGKDGRTNTVTVAWDVIGLHEEWATHGIPPYWSEQLGTRSTNTSGS